MPSFSFISYRFQAFTDSVYYKFRLLLNNMLSFLTQPLYQFFSSNSFNSQIVLNLHLNYSYWIQYEHYWLSSCTHFGLRNLLLCWNWLVFNLFLLFLFRLKTPRNGELYVCRSCSSTFWSRHKGLAIDEAISHLPHFCAGKHVGWGWRLVCEVGSSCLLLAEV